jgi:hypothetical protein
MQKQKLNLSDIQILLLLSWLDIYPFRSCLSSSTPTEDFIENQMNKSILASESHFQHHCCCLIATDIDTLTELELSQWCGG